MKKLFIIGALALSVMSFAKTNEIAKTKEVAKVEKSAAKFRGMYSVTFNLPCGGQITAYYYTTTTEGTSEFNHDLALAVNMTVEENCGSGSSQSGIGF